MYYRISDHVALRSWVKLEGACCVRGLPAPCPLTRREFDTLLLCDGQHDLSSDETLATLTKKGYIAPCEKGCRPSAWSVYRHYENRCFPKMNLMITGKCNYNCLHCFNAADNAPLMTEWSFEDLCGLFDQARDCGVHAFTITGGEPMVHKRFLDILREIHRRDMFVEELNTNGFFLTQDVLDGMKEIGCRPLMKISFDGIGHHDWLRKREGAEQRTLDAIRLCIDNGFHVKVQTQVHRKNVGSMFPTAHVMDDMGVDVMRIIRTTEVPRWLANAGDACLDMEEYYGAMLGFAKKYADSGMHIMIDIWQFLYLNPDDRSFWIAPVSCAEGAYRDGIPGCRGNRSMVGVTSSGDVVPCLQVSGTMLNRGIHFGNLHTDRLKDLLSAGPYLQNVCSTVGDVRKNNPKCAACKWFEACTGGCRAMGLLYSGEQKNWYGEDFTKCRFFENGWYEKVADAFPGWQNHSIVRL